MKEYVGIRQATKKGFIPCEVGGVADLSIPTSKTRRGRVQGSGQICPTLMTGEPMICRIERGNEITADQYGIRKLTPLECWRLMGFSDEDFLAAKTVTRDGAKRLLAEYPAHEGKRRMDEAERISKMSNTQLYKQAGNSIVVDVLYYIYKNLYEAMPYLFDDLRVSSYFSGIGAFESALDKLYADVNCENFTNPQTV